MSNTLIVASMLAAAFFPTADAVQALVSESIFLIVLPAVFTRFFLKEKLSSIGLSLGNEVRGGLWLGTLIAVTFLCIALATHYTDILSQFTIPLSVRLSFLVFLIYTLIAGMYIFIFEFFFRGFVFFVWERVVGINAIFIQTVFFMVFFLLASYGKVSAPFFIMSVMAIGSGLLVERSRSILYSFLFSYISVILGVGSILFFVK